MDTVGRGVSRGVSRGLSVRDVPLHLQERRESGHHVMSRVCQTRTSPDGQTICKMRLWERTQKGVQMVESNLFGDGEAYELTMGRWSQLVGDKFIDWLDAPKGL